MWSKFFNFFVRDDSNKGKWVSTHNYKRRYGERGAPAAKQKAQIILDVLSSIFATQMVRRSRRSGA
jgi:hypothetical protein